MTDTTEHEFPPLAPLPDQSSLPVLTVHLNADGTLSYKADQKGARWRSGFESLSEVEEDAEAIMPDHYVIDYVESRE